MRTTPLYLFAVVGENGPRGSGWETVLSGRVGREVALSGCMGREAPVRNRQRERLSANVASDGLTKFIH